MHMCALHTMANRNNNFANAVPIEMRSGFRRPRHSNGDAFVPQITTIARSRGCRNYQEPEIFLQSCVAPLPIAFPIMCIIHIYSYDTHTRAIMHSLLTHPIEMRRG